MNSEILTITLPEEKPPVVDVKQRFEVGGIILLARLTLINNVLPESAVQQKPLLSTEEAALRTCLVSMEQRIVAAVAAAQSKAAVMVQDEMQKMAADAGLPPGMF